MRVAMLSAAPIRTNGWGKYARELITALGAQGVAVDLITETNAPDNPDLTLSTYHRVLPSLTPPRRLSSLRLLASIPTVQRLVRQSDAVHVVAEPYTLAVPFARRLIVTAHGTYLPRTVRKPVFGLIYREIYRRAGVICVSTYTERQVRAAVPEARTVVIPNGVDVARYQQPGIVPGKNDPTVLAVGQLKARKGYHILVQAMRLVREVIPDVQAVFIGDTSDRKYVDTLQSQIEAVGLRNAVHILGRVPDESLLGWYHAADVFALPAINVGGKFEGYGLVYAEASAAGLPVVGTLDCGAEDAIRHGETGFLVAQNDPPAVAQVLIRLLTDSELRMKMGAAGRTFACELSWERVARRVIDQYQATPSR
jgi:phosphatidyl-myo-inositol dimannoside synthase